MTTDRCKIPELTNDRDTQIRSGLAPVTAPPSGNFSDLEQPAVLADDSEGNRSGLESTASPQMAVPAGGTPSIEAPTYGEISPTEEGARATDRQSAEQGDVLVNENLEPKSDFAMRDGATRPGGGHRESPDAKSLGAATESRPKSGKKRAGDDDPFEVSRFWAEHMVPIGGNPNLDYPPNISSFRDYPERSICDIAEDPLEAMLLAQAGHFHRAFLGYMSDADQIRDPGCRMQFLSFVMRLSDQTNKISEAFRRGRRDGRQEVIVKHQDSDGGPVRRSRAHRSDPRANAPKVSGAKRSAAP